MDNWNIPKLPQFKITDIPMPKIPVLKDQNLADAFHYRLCEYIITFEKKLSEYERVGLRLVSFGETVTILVEEIGYWNPSLISFTGLTTSSEQVQLIQHVSQLSFLLVAIKVPTPIEPEQRIGFKLGSKIARETNEEDTE